jgi:acetylornithine/N-succinyldiaminopimelate aminotransferase
MLEALILPAPVAEPIVVECRAAGLLVNSPRADILRFMPALNVSEAEIDRMADVLGPIVLRAVRAVASGAAVSAQESRPAR